MNLKTFMYAEAKRQEVKYILCVCIYEVLEQANLINDDSRSMVAWDTVVFEIIFKVTGFGREVDFLTTNSIYIFIIHLFKSYMFS